MQVYVRNDNAFDHNEEFNGDKIHIPAGGKVKMDRMKAIQFLGQFTPIVLTGQGTPDERFIKKLRIESIEGEKPEEVKPVFRCEKDGKEFKTQDELDRWIEENYADEIIDEDAQKKVKKRAAARK